MALRKAVCAKSVGLGKNDSPLCGFIWWIPESSTRHRGILTFRSRKGGFGLYVWQSGDCMSLHTRREELGSPVRAPAWPTPGLHPGPASILVTAHPRAVTGLQLCTVVPFPSLKAQISFFPLFWSPGSGLHPSGPICLLWHVTCHGARPRVTLQHLTAESQDPGSTALPRFVCHRQNLGSSWGDRVSHPATGAPQQIEFQFPLENE